MQDTAYVELWPVNRIYQVCAHVWCVQVGRDPPAKPGVFGLLLGAGSAQPVRPRILMKRALP
jgi:hypothetical protein